jgi:hypothetical protein
MQEWGIRDYSEEGKSALIRMESIPIEGAPLLDHLSRGRAEM